MFCYNTHMKYRAVATTVFGVESMLADELRHLNFENITKQDGRVFFDADEREIAVANICLRTAERVYIVIGECDAPDSEALYQGLKALPFSAYLRRDDAFPVDVNLVKTPHLTSKSVTQKTAKKAIVDSLRHIYRTEFFSEIGPVHHIYVHIIKGRATALLDTSGSGLNRRGYREYGNAAPLRETLAAALVFLSGWRSDTKLIDAFCGSGTILIEAALFALGIPPNRSRHFPFESWEEFRDVDMEDLRRMILGKPASELHLEGYDIDPAAIRQARVNAKKAGVEAHIHFQVRDVRHLSTSVKAGTLLSNLPYGERLLDRRAAAELNEVLGIVMNSRGLVKNGAFDQWRKCFYTAHEDFESDYGAKADRNRKLYNAGIKSYFYRYEPKHPKRGDGE